jgi:hypothetical protein
MDIITNVELQIGASSGQVTQTLVRGLYTRAETAGELAATLSFLVRETVVTVHASDRIWLAYQNGERVPVTADESHSDVSWEEFFPRAERALGQFINRMLHFAPSSAKSTALLGATK